MVNYEAHDVKEVVPMLQSGFNPEVAAAAVGIEVTIHAMSELVEYESLRSFWDL